MEEYEPQDDPGFQRRLADAMACTDSKARFARLNIGKNLRLPSLRSCPQGFLGEEERGGFPRGELRLPGFH